MNIITGYRGEPHITAQEDRDLNIGLVGNSLTDVYVLNVGQQLAADIVSANEIRIRDGILVLQGCAASIDYGAYDSLTISNGSQGMLRTDIIAAQYSKDGDTNIESLELVVVEGTPAASDPQPPTLQGGDVQGGDSLVQVPLYQVNIDGVAIDSVDAQFIAATSLAWCTLTPATEAKWDAILGLTANLNQIIKYLADFAGSVYKELTMSNTNWNSGSCTITDSSKYCLFVCWAGVPTIAVRTPHPSGDKIYAFSIADAGTGQVTRAFNCTVNGDTWTITQIGQVGHTAGSNHGSKATPSITMVVGLLPKL